MKQPGLVLHHLGDDYLLVEGGFDAATRTVTVLCEPDNARFPHAEGTRPVTWCDQGEWFPLARWSREDLILQDDAYEEGRVLLNDLVERYLDERPEPPALLWALSGPRGFAGTLEAILPMGLAVTVFDDEERAEEEARTADATVVAVHSPLRFFTQLTREGYAGAMWNRVLPVYACIDGEGALHFLRVGRAGDRVELEILGPDEAWTSYDGEEAVEFLEHGDACDARLVESLGKLPPLEWPEDGVLWSVGPAPSRPGIVTRDEETLAYGLLFSSEERAAAWVEDAENAEDFGAWPVPDLGLYLASPELPSGVALLNPGSHRAQGGTLWRDGPRVVLDSFSGFWAFEGGGFTALD